MCWVMPPASRLGDVGLADGVEQRGLAVVDVAHDGDHRRRAATRLPAGLRLLGAAAGSSSLELHLFLERDDHRLDAELLAPAPAASSGSSTWLMLAMMPRLNSELIRSRDAHAELLGELAQGHRPR